MFYREHIEPRLISTLDNLNIDFFFTLTLLNVHADSELLVSPLIIIYTTSKGVTVVKASLDQIWDVNDFSEFLVCITQGTYINAADENISSASNTYTSHEDWKCGMSIGFYDKSATSGAVLENSRNEYAALTCAHFFDTRKINAVGLRVTQPSYEDFCLLFSRTESRKQDSENMLQSARTEEMKSKYEADLHRTTNVLEQLNRYDHSTPENYQKAMELATVIKSSYEVIDYNGRRCLRDYALLKLIDHLPGVYMDVERPEKGYLEEIDWKKEPLSVAELQWDMHVKKRGRSTGVTYGIIAGVHGVMKSSADGPRREYWALPEAPSTSLYEFSNKGDSGALVWTDKGDAVGIIIAGWTALFERPPVMAVVLPNGYWDTKNIPFFRH